MGSSKGTGALSVEVEGRLGDVAAPRDLVAQRLGRTGDPWSLALVQRAEVWDHVRMRHLLDSLIAGYPIGAILLCRVREGSQVIRNVDGVRVLGDADPDAWQILDGQQRINALFSMLTREGRYGRFYLNMTTERTRPGPTQGRAAKDRGLTGIAWRPDHDTDPQGSIEPLEGRARHLDLAGWADWAFSTDLSEVPVDDVRSTLQAIDPGFTADLSEQATETAARQLNDLLAAWHRPSVPILSAEVGSPLDVLEIFTRINLGGVSVVGRDVYFAAVKTFWPDAEQRLDDLVAASPFLGGRLDALRFVSRLASRGLGQGDLLPLQVDRLAGRSGAPLVDAMRHLTSDASRVRAQLTKFSQWMTRHSGLGRVLDTPPKELWDDVLGWVATTDRGDDDWWAQNVEAVDSYLLGATLFGYRRVMRDRFHRLAFLESLAAGAEGRKFPLERILTTARAGAGLRGPRRVVLGLASAEDRTMLANENSYTLTLLAQRVPYKAEPTDWDHIFASAQAHRMWTRNKNGRRVHHPDRHLVNSAGNLWALGSSANRALQDRAPGKKFELLRKWQSDPSTGHLVMPEDQWSLTPEEVRAFIKVDRLLLSDDLQSTKRGMRLFKKTVGNRSRRLLDSALERFPKVAEFARDADVLPEDPTSAFEFSKALGLTGIPTRTAAKQHSSAAEAAATSSGLHPDWAGRETELTEVVKSVTKALAVGRAPAAKRQMGFELGRFVHLAAPYPDPYLGFGFTGRFSEINTTPFWVQIDSNTEGYEIAAERIASSRFSERARNAAWPPDVETVEQVCIPVDAPAHLTWDELTEHVLAQVKLIRDVIVE